MQSTKVLNISGSAASVLRYRGFEYQPWRTAFLGGGQLQCTTSSEALTTAGISQVLCRGHVSSSKGQEAYGLFASRTFPCLRHLKTAHIPKHLQGILYLVHLVYTTLSQNVLWQCLLQISVIIWGSVDPDPEGATLPVRHHDCSQETNSSSDAERCGYNKLCRRSGGQPGPILAWS